jgi:hypothetical protein
MEEYYLEEKDNFRTIINILLFISIFLVLIFILIDILGFFIDFSLTEQEINNIYFPIGIFILIIFIIDLYLLEKESKNVKEFLKNNWLDILATIPVGLIGGGPVTELLKIFKIQKLMKFTRIGKIIKSFKVISQIKKNSLKEEKIRY